MAIIDNTLAAQVPTFDAATPLKQAAQLQAADQEIKQAQYKQAQFEIGSEARGLAAVQNTPEFPKLWAEAADRMAQKGLLTPQAHQQWRNTPSPLLLKQMIAQTEDPTLSFRKEEAAREQKNTDRSYGLQASRFAFEKDQAKEKPTIQKVKDAAGNETLLQVFPDGRSRPITASEAAAAADGPNNPFAPSGKQTEGQANASLYASRMFQSERILRDSKSVDAATSTVERAIDKAPIVGSSGRTGLGNFAQSEDYQKFDQAQRDFINATLRRESGAVISEQEFDNARKQYFPRPGDSKSVIEQKKRNRMEAIKGIAGAAGPAFRAPYTFDGKGEIQERGGKPAEKKRLRFNPETGDFE